MIPIDLVAVREAFQCMLITLGALSCEGHSSRASWVILNWECSFMSLLCTSWSQSEGKDLQRGCWYDYQFSNKYQFLTNTCSIYAFKLLTVWLKMFISLCLDLKMASNSLLSYKLLMFSFSKILLTIANKFLKMYTDKSCTGPHMSPHFTPFPKVLIHIPCSAFISSVGWHKLMWHLGGETGMSHGWLSIQRWLC